MKKQISCPALYRIALLVLGFALSLSLAPAAFANDDDDDKTEHSAKAPLPLTPAFDKVQGGEKGPYVLKLTNTGSEALRVRAKVLLAVKFHADKDARKVAAQKVGAGETITIGDLSAGDKVVLKAKGYAPLQVEVPAQK